MPLVIAVIQLTQPLPIKAKTGTVCFLLELCIQCIHHADDCAKCLVDWTGNKRGVESELWKCIQGPGRVLSCNIHHRVRDEVICRTQRLLEKQL